MFCWGGDVEGLIISDRKYVCIVSFYQEFRRTANSQELRGSRRLERRSSEKVSFTLAWGWGSESNTWTTGCSPRRPSGEVAVGGGDHDCPLPGAPVGSRLSPGENLCGGRWRWEKSHQASWCSVNSSPVLNPCLCWGVRALPDWV